MRCLFRFLFASIPSAAPGVEEPEFNEQQRDGNDELCRVKDAFINSRQIHAEEDSDEQGVKHQQHGHQHADADDKYASRLVGFSFSLRVRHGCCVMIVKRLFESSWGDYRMDWRSWVAGINQGPLNSDEQEKNNQ